MSYIKTYWETGDVITADALNNIEEGIEAVDNNSHQSNLVIDLIIGSDFDADSYSTTGMKKTIQKSLTREDLANALFDYNGEYYHPDVVFKSQNAPTTFIIVVRPYKSPSESSKDRYGEAFRQINIFQYNSLTGLLKS